VRQFLNPILGPPSKVATDCIAGICAPSSSGYLLPKKTREAAAAGACVDLFVAFKRTAAAAARAQTYAGSSGRRSDAPVAMIPHADLPTPPLMWKNLIDFYKACYPGFEAELTRYALLMERIAVLVSNRGFLILDNVWRSFVFENGVSFLPGGAFPAIIAVEFQFVITHHLRPAPDAAAFTCSNCGRQHRAEECPSFTLAFKHTSDPSGSRQRRGRSSSRKPARSPSESLSPPPRSRSSSHRTTGQRQAKPKSAVKFADSAASSATCKLWASTQECRFGSSCKFSH
jgi:hypothetical protein